MIRFPLRKITGAALSFLILALAPGHEAYHAAAQTMGRSAAGEAGVARGVVPSISNGLNSAVPTLSPSALSVSPSLMAPAAAPSAVLVPSALPTAVVSVPSAKPIELKVQTGRIVPIKAVPSSVATEAKAEVALVRQAASTPRALTVLSHAASKPENLPESGAMFDGTNAKTPTETSAVSVPKSGALVNLKGAIRKGAVALALAVATLGIQAPAHAQQAPPAPPAVTAPAPAPAAQPADTVEARKELPRPVIVTSAVFDRQGMTVGERLHLTFTLKNTSDKPVTLLNLRASIQEALPQDLELQGKSAEAPLVLAPGETKTVVYEAIPFGSGILSLEKGIAVIATDDRVAYPEGIDLVLGSSELTVKTVLTPDWKDKGLRDIVGVKRGLGPDWMWLAAIPLGLLLLVGVHRMVAARKLYPKLDANRLSLVVATQAEIARLRAEESLDSASFLARYQDLTAQFMIDFAGLKKAARDAKALEKDLAKSFYDAGQIGVAAKLAAQAEAARFSGAGIDAAERGRMLDRLNALVESVAGKAGKPVEKKLSGMALLALLPGAAGLTFGSPWVLALLVPYLVYVVWSYRNRGRGEKFAVSSAAQATPKARTWREKLAGLPKTLRMLAIGLIIVALARPMIGTERSETFIPSTDTMVSIDLSGSMSGAKLQGVRDAVKAYVEEQRRGTENRVGMVTFSDKSYLDVKLTTDYDALIAHLKELETTGSTAIGKSMLTSIAHFLELNALELDAKTDPRAAEVQKLLRADGLPAALAYAKQHPDLMKKIVQPERVKIVVIFTDGDSNTGIDPQAAAEIAAQLGIKVYGVGIAGPNEGFNEATLRGVAEKTGAKFYRAGDAQAMADVLLEISRLEKSPAKIVSAVSVKDYTSLLAILAFLLLAGELALVNTRMRTLYGMALIMGLSGAPMMPTAPFAGLQATSITAQVSAKPETPTQSVPAEVIEGNRLYNQGRFAEALKKYGEALERHPDVPELYFNMADAYLRLGQNEKAEAAWAKYLTLTSDPKLQSQTIFNLGNSALAAGDAQKAMEFYKEALRRDANNQDAKWNLEALKQAQKEQQQQQQQGKDGKPKDGKQDGKPGQGKQQGQPGKGKPQQGQGQGKPGQGQPGQGQPGQGQPGQGQPGQGQPGDGKPQPGDGKSPAQVKPDAKQGTDKLGDALGEQEGGEKSDARKAIPKRGKGVWGFAALPFAMAGQGVVFSSTMFLWVVGIGLPIAVLLVAWGIKKKIEAARKLSPGTAPKSFASWTGARRFLGKSALALGAIALIGLAAGDPRGGAKDERVNFGGKDIVVTVDGSYSMIYAEDGRMERTQKELNEFISRLQGTDRVGLVVFAGKARTASPISVEYGNFEFKINRLDVESRDLNQGSDLAGAIKYSANHFEVAKKLGDRQRIMIVISDGDVPDAELEAAIASAVEHKVTVYTIGVGDAAGTKIKVPSAEGDGTEYMIDDQTGAPAITKLNEGPLRKLAERTGGAYFKAGGKTSIDGILAEVSRLEKGQKGDVIKSPSPVGIYFLWPALIMLLLDLVLPGRSLLKRGASKGDDKGKGGKGGPGGAALMGAALIPLGAWPQILPFAALAAVVAGYLAADSWSGGKITRGIKEWWQTRRGFIQQGLAKDLIHVYDLREADERRLTAFVKGWQDAKESLRETMITMAAHDEALWREKLTAIYLSGAEPETLDKVLVALRRGARVRMEPLGPIVKRIEARRAQLAWLSHTDARTRLAALRATADGQPVAFEAPPETSAPVSFWTGLKRKLSVAVLAVMIALTGVSGVGTYQFAEQQRVAAEAAMKLFYAEDIFIFSDRYVDARIPEQVLPALKRWTESPRTAGSDFERALTILRESPDPKADNILVAVFRRAGVLPLTNNGETILLRSLIERQNDVLWAAMDQLIQGSAQDEGASRMLVKLVMLGVEDGDMKTVVQLFRVLKSPNKQVQQASAGALYAFLAQDGGRNFFTNLMIVQAVHQNDSSLQLWTASFAFRRLGQPDATEADMLASKAFFDAAIANAARFDALRLEVYKNTPPDQEVKSPPSLTAILLGMASGMQGEDGGAPAPLAGAARYVVTKAVTSLIQDAEAKIPGLHERLIKDGVVLPDTQSGGYYGGYDDYYDDHGHGGYYGRGNYGTSKNYRDAYKLSHLRALGKALEEMGTPLAADPEKFAVRELLDRAAAQLEPAFEAGAKSGMMEGGTAPEAAADDLYSALKTGDSTFSGHALLRELRAKGLAPAVGDVNSRLAFPEALDAAALAKLRTALLDVARSGKAWDAQGAARPLTWAEKLWLVDGVAAVDAARAKNFPGAETLAPADEDALAIARLSKRLSADDKNAVLALEVEKTLLERAAKGPVDSMEAGNVLLQVLAAVKGGPSESAAVDALAAALKAPNGAAFAPAAKLRAAEALKTLGESAERADRSLNAKLVDAGVRESDNGWRSDIKLRHFRVLAALVPASARELSRWENLAALAGAPAGDAAGEAAADEANVVLLAGYKLFPSSEFNDGLRQAGLMSAATNNLSDYKSSYTRAELEAVRDYVRGVAASGRTPGASARELNFNEKLFLLKAIDRLDAVLAQRFGATAASAPVPALELIRLARTLEGKPSPEAALRAQEKMLAILAARPAVAADADEVLKRVYDAVEGTAAEAAAYRTLGAALSGPAGKDLAPRVRPLLEARAIILGEKAEYAFPGLLDATIAAGLRDDENTWKDSFKLRQYRELRAAIAAKAAAAKSQTAEQREAASDAARLLPVLEAVAAAAGVPSGDDPSEIAADLLNAPLQAGYSLFPGSVFNDQLRAMKLMDPASTGNALGDHKQAYTKAEVVQLRNWLRGILASGQGWNPDGTTRRALTPEERTVVEAAAAAADRALAGFDKPAGVRGFGMVPLAPMALAALPGIAPWMIFLLLGAGAAYIAWKLLKEPAEAALEPRETISPATLSRSRRIELHARRMATAVNGGAFRSRFIGAGGTEFAEARPYQGEDRRDIDWKTSAKKDELYSKKFELERDMALMLVVDISRSGRFGTRGEDKRTAIEDAAAVLALAAAHDNIRVGAILVSDRVEAVIPPKGGQRHAMSLVDQILKAEASGTSTDLRPGLETAARLLRSRAMVAVVSDFIAPDFKEALGALASRHDVRPIRVTDPAEMAPLPDVGLLPVIDAETGNTRVLDTSSKAVRSETAAAISRREAMIEASFEAARLTPVEISTEGDPLDSLETAFHPKAKQPFKP